MTGNVGYDLTILREENLRKFPGARFLEPKSIAETSIISKTARSVDRQVVIPVEKKQGPTDNFTGKIVVQSRLFLKNQVEEGDAMTKILVPPARSITSLEAVAYTQGHPMHKMGPELRQMPFEHASRQTNAAVTTLM